MNNKYIIVKTRNFVEKIPADEVLTVQREGRKVLVVAEDRSYEFYDKIENIEQRLDQRFFKCHSGCIINMEKVRLMEDQEILFYNGFSLYLGRTNFVKTKQYYYTYHKEIVQ